MGRQVVPIPSIYKIFSVHDLTFLEVKVSMLFDKNLNRWDRNKLEDLFAT
jgi:hypothetical protein